MKRLFARVAASVLTATLLTVQSTGPIVAGKPHVLVLADGQDVHNLNPLLSTTESDATMAALTGAYLTRDDGRTPELAAKLPTLANGGISRDGRTVVFHLRRGLRWSDGAPLTSADAVFTTKLITAKNSAVAAQSGWDEIVAVDAASPYDVRFKLRRPYAWAVGNFFDGGGYAIVPEHVLRGADLRTTTFNSRPIGAGPFRYTQFDRGDKVELEANPYYFRGRPKLDRIVVKFLLNAGSQEAELLTGEIDVASVIDDVRLRQLTKRSGIAIVRTRSKRGTFLGFQTMRPPFDDARVRRALRYALDRDEIVRKLYGPGSYVTDDVLPKFDPDYGDGIATSPYDPVRAGALLDAAGWRLGADGVRRRGGEPLTLDLVEFIGIDFHRRVVELLRSQWRKVGITLSTRLVNAATFYAPGGIGARGAFGAELFGQAMDSIGMTTYYTCRVASPKGLDDERYCNPRVDALLENVDASYDPAVRIRDSVAARKLIARDAAFVPIGWHADLVAIRSNVVNLDPNLGFPFGNLMKLDVR